MILPLSFLKWIVLLLRWLGLRVSIIRSAWAKQSMISSKKICPSKKINLSMYILKIQNSLQMHNNQALENQATVQLQIITLKISTMSCLIWLHLWVQEDVLAITKATRTLATPRLLSVISVIWVSTLTNMVRPKMHGSEKRIRCEKSLRNKPSIS